MPEHHDHAILTPNSVELTREKPKKNPASNVSKAQLVKEVIAGKKRESRLQQLLNQSHEYILIIGRDGKLVWANNQAKELLKSLGEPLQEHWNFWLTHMKEDSYETTSQIEVNGESRQFRVRIYRKEESTSKESEHWLYLVDTTEMMLVSEDVIRKKTMLESISNSVQEGIFRSNKEEGIIYVNQAFAKMFGYETVDEVMQIDPYDLYTDPSRRDDFLKIIEEQDSFFNEEVEFKRKDGSTFWGLVSSVPYYDPAGNCFHDGAIRDVTQLREVERGLKENYEELQKVNRELDRFVYSTSHDLRAPLVSISGLINITRIEQDEKLREKYLGLMDRSIQKLDDFIKDIIGYSRNSRTELKFEPIDLESLLEESFHSLTPQGSSQTFEKIVNIELDGPFVSDATRLTTIFNNLLSNAFRYSDPEKEISRIEVNIKVQNKKAFISVKDNGIGIAPKYLDKIFQMFYRATQKSKGSGIGLYIVKEAIEKLKGEIQVKSALGKGTEFVLEIPDGGR